MSVALVAAGYALRLTDPAPTDVGCPGVFTRRDLHTPEGVPGRPDAVRHERGRHLQAAASVREASATSPRGRLLHGTGLYGLTKLLGKDLCRGSLHLTGVNVVQSGHGMPALVRADFRRLGPAWREGQHPGNRALLKEYDLSGAARHLGWWPRVTFLDLLPDLSRRGARGEDVRSLTVPGALSGEPPV